MKKQTKVISLVLIFLFMLQIIFPVVINIEMDMSYAATVSSNLGTYITKADNVTVVGNNSRGSDTHSQWGNYTYVTYNNTEPDASKYVIFSNAVVTSNGTKYDLVIYPFKVNANAQVTIETSTYGKIPVIKIPEVAKAGNRYAGYKLVITEHGNINKPISMNISLRIIRFG